MQGVSKVQWQELFAIVHRICAWIDGGGDMVRKELEAEVHRYIVAAERVSNPKFEFMKNFVMRLEEITSL